MAVVTLQEVCKVYPGGVKAVDRVSLCVKDSEFVVLVGPSGCGKSTTLRMVAGLEEISSGTIAIDERVVNDVPPKDRDIAMVFQNYALYPYMSVYENMAFSLKLRRRELGLSRSAIDAKVREAAAALGLTELLERKPRALSGGQRQRVAVGRAIVRSPKAFLFDEPLSNLDAKLRLEMRGELKRLHRCLGTTTLYVTHDQEEAMTLGDRMVVMKDGLVQQCGPPLEVYDRPVNRFVAGFVGSPPMNFLSGTLRRDGDGWYFDEGAGRVRLPADLADRAAGFRDREVVLGVRPEGLRLTAADAGSVSPPAGNGAWLPGRVAVTEPLGQNMDVVFSTGRHERLVARVDARCGIREGQALRIDVDSRAAHLFEAGESGVNLTASDGGAAARVG
jgi:multiple sugar transport system ATP-binding protein